jgi:hypothetical protein
MGVLRDSIYPFHRSPSSSVLWIGSKASLWEVGFFLYNMRDAAEAETTGGPPGDGDVLAFAPLPSSLCCCCVAYCPLLMLHDYYCVPVQASMEWKYIWIDGPTVHASFLSPFVAVQVHMHGTCPLYTPCKIITDFFYFGTSLMRSCTMFVY